MTSARPTIVKCTIGPYPRPMPAGRYDQMPRVKVFLNNGEEKTLFNFYPDEISFEEWEFIGLDVDAAMGLKYEREKIVIRNYMKSS